MKTRTFFAGLSWLLLLNLAVKPAWIFLIDRQVQNAVGYETYGRYFALFNLTYVLLFAADAGLTNLLTQRMAAKAAVNLRQLFVAKLFLLLAYAALCLLIGAAADVQNIAWLFYFVCIQALSSLYLFLRGLLTSAQLFKTDAVFSVLDKTLMLLLCAGPVYGAFGSVNITLFLQLQLMATSVSVIALMLHCLRKRLFVSAGQKQSFTAIAGQTFPFLLIVLLMATHYRVDGFLLERWHNDGAAQTGIYAAAYRLLDTGNMVGYLCASFLVPFVARHQTEGKTIEKTLLLSRHGLMAVGITVATFAYAFAPWLQQNLYHTNAAYNSQVITLSLAVLPAYYLVHVYGSALTAVGALRTFIIILVVCVLVNLCLNALLIPVYGALGCCVAALVSQWGCGLALWLVASQRLAVSYGIKSFIAYVIFAAVCVVLFAFAATVAYGVWITLAAGTLAVIFLLTQKARLKRFAPFLNS